MTSPSLLLALLQDFILKSQIELQAMSVSVEELHVVDAALDSLSAALSAIRTHRNKTARINSLPPEILALIFEHVLRRPSANGLVGDAKNIVFANPDTPSLVKATHVCRHWRAVALDWPSLWTEVAAHSASAATFVERASTGRLSLYSAVVNGQLARPQKQLLWSVMPRISRLSIVVDTAAQLSVYQKILNELGRSLEALSIVAHETRKGQVFRGVEIPLFGGSPAHALKTLYISTVQGVYPADRFPKLTSLHLSGYTCGRTFAPLIKLFSRTPALQNFHLHSPAPEIDLRNRWAVPIDEVNVRISLPNIGRFCIVLGDSVPELIQALLSVLHLPQEAVISTWIDSAFLTGSWIERQSCRNLPLHDVTLTVGTIGITFAATCGTSGSFCHGNSHPYIRHGLFTNVTAVDIHTLTLVKVLRIECGRSWTWADTNTLPSLLQMLPALTELVVRDYRDALRHLCKALEQSDPRLVHNLSNVTYITLDPRFSDPGTTHLVPLFHATALRAQNGLALKHFAVCCPYIASEQVLYNVHGVGSVSFSSVDPWAQYERTGVEPEVRAHWRAVSGGLFGRSLR